MEEWVSGQLYDILGISEANTEQYIMEIGTKLL